MQLGLIWMRRGLVNDCPDIAIRIGNESFRAPDIMPWFLHNLVARLLRSLYDGFHIADFKVRIHAQAIALAFNARRFPVPAIAPEINARIPRLQRGEMADL